MIANRLKAEHAAALEDMKREKFGEGWKPAGPRIELEADENPPPTPKKQKPVIPDFNVDRPAVRTSARDQLLEKVRAKYRPGDVVSAVDAAEACGLKEDAARFHIQVLKKEGRWPFESAARGRRKAVLKQNTAEKPAPKPVAVETITESVPVETETPLVAAPADDLAAVVETGKAFAATLALWAVRAIAAMAEAHLQSSVHDSGMPIGRRP